MAGFTVSHMLKYTEQVGFTTRRRLVRSHPQSGAEAVRISIAYTDKLAFSLPGRFPHERMKCERFGGFADARHAAFQVPAETRGGWRGGVRSSNRQICHLIVQRKKKRVVETAVCCAVCCVGWGDNSVFTLAFFFFFFFLHHYKRR